MKAVIRTGLLGTNLSFLQDYPTPSSSSIKVIKNIKNHVYIKVKAASINPVDYKLPKVIGGKGVGIDFCGTIIEKINIIDNDDDDDDEHNKNNTKKFEIGDDVFGTCSLLSSSSGSLAEYCIADIDKIAKVPKKNNNNDDNNHNHNTWSYLECAALPVAYMSALQSLRIGKITPVETSINSSSSDDNDGNNSQKAVLVIGASGGCGIAGIQLCKAMGIGRIVGICSDRNIDFVKELGATEVVSYSNDTELQSFFDKNSGTFDCVYDAATNSGGGEDYWSMSQKLLKKGDDEKNKIHGEYVALNGPASKWIRAFAGRQKAHESIIMVKSNSSDLELILSLLNKIKAKPIINVVQFSEKGLEDAFKQLKSRRTKGKIVFEVY